MLEYQECRKVAAQLGQIVTYDLYASAPAEIEYDMTYTRVHESADIARAYLSAAGRGKKRLPPPADAFSGIVSRKIVSVNSRIIYVMRRLYKGAVVRFKALFPNGSEKRSSSRRSLPCWSLSRASAYALRATAKTPM